MKTIKHTHSILTIIVLVLSFTFLSCKKTQVGPAGADGAQGVAGTPGNANVKSVVFTVSNWAADSICKNFNYKYHTADLSSTVLEKGAVMLYRGDNTGDNTSQWTPMPLSCKGFQFSFVIEMSTIQITVINPDGNMPSNPGAQKFKLVIIPPAL